MSTEQVPTNGFVNPAPAVAPTVPNQSFQVPPAGDPARVPGSNPVHSHNQQPGWVQQTQPAAVPAQAQPAATAATPDMNSVMQMLQAALAGKDAQATAAVPAAQPAADTARPSWMQSSANDFDVTQIDDPIIRSMATVMQTVGKDLDLDRVLGKALTHGDLTLIDEAYLNEKAGANAPQLAEIARGIVQAVGAKADAVTKSVYDEAGGEAAWDTSVAAFNNAAPQELRITVAQMLNSTNENFIKAGAKIVAEFGKNSGMIPQIGKPLLSSEAAGAAGQGLSKVQFQAELSKLRPDTPGYEEARTALFTRRSLGKRANM
jgi:hypothetical protein